MPIPEPGEKEDKKEFLERCHSSDVMNREYTEAQKSAICYKKWREKDRE